VLTVQPKGDIIKTVKEEEVKEMTKAVIIKKYFDRVTFKYLTEEEYNAIIKKERLKDYDITLRFRCFITSSPRY